MAALPKHALIFQSLHEAIKRGDFKSGARLPSEKALARRYKVSRPTVAQALRELTHMELVERHRGAGSFVRHAPVAAGTLGLLADGLGATEMMQPISTEIARAARAAGWATVAGAAVADRPPDEIAREWAGRGVAGVFFAPLEHHPVRAAVNRALVECLRARGLAVVLLDRDVGEFPERSPLDLVAIDDFFAGYDLAAYLLEYGCTRLVFTARPSYPSTTDLRLAGARAAVERAIARCTDKMEKSKKINLDFVVCMPTEKERVGIMLDRTKPDGIIASNDSTAAELLQTLRQLRRSVPGSVMVAGFDDVRYASLLSPPLTTMRQPCAALGAAAVETMLGRLRQPDMPALRVLLRAELVVRRSTAAPRSLANDPA